jgi:hypothetical protein
MPHVIVKLYAGRSEQQKSRLADALPKAARAGGIEAPGGNRAIS